MQVMYLRNYKKIFLILLTAWFAINLIQALVMEILSDEAYYRLYAEHLDWGYYDHPPVVALMIKASSFIFSGNLGIRFMTVLLQLGTLALIWKTIENRKPDSQNVFTFFIISGSICMFSGYGVITSPDAPLLFFTALFFFAYKKFIRSQNWPATLLVSVAMAGLVYSKYQAVLVIGFVVLSNLGLLKSFKFWFAGILALAILSPHFYWQFSHNFPSLQYHLVYRLEDFTWKHLLEYLPNQLALFNPFTFGAVIFVLIKYTPSGPFNRSMYFQIIGFIAFFWLTAFRDHVEPNWTIACSIPMIILLSERSAIDPALFRYIRSYVLPSILLVLAMRILLITNIDLTRSIGYSGKKEKFEFIETVAKELPVIFTGSYQAPSLYPFYTGREATVLSSVYSRQTQFDLWQFEKKYHNKPVFVSSLTDRRSKVYGSGFNRFCGFKTDSLQTVNRMKITYDLSETVIHPGDSLNLSIALQNTYDYNIDFNHHQFPVRVCLVLIKSKEKNNITVQDVSLSEPIDIITGGQTLERSLTAIIPELEDGNYKLGICLNNIFGPSFNSRFTKIILKGID
jgi:4-amino-4-deoxy-L-arabinose transferase-like glycosyltransferase